MSNEFELIDLLASLEIKRPQAAATGQADERVYHVPVSTMSVIKRQLREFARLTTHSKYEAPPKGKEPTDEQRAFFRSLLERSAVAAGGAEL